MYVEKMNRHCIPGLTMSCYSPDGNLVGGLGTIKTMYTGLARTRIVLCQRLVLTHGRNRTL